MKGMELEISYIHMYNTLDTVFAVVGVSLYLSFTNKLIMITIIYFI